MLTEIETIKARPDWTLNPDERSKEIKALALGYAERAASLKTSNQEIKSDLETILKECFNMKAEAEALTPQKPPSVNAESALTGLLQAGAARGKAKLYALLFNFICCALAERGFCVYTKHERAALKTTYGVSFPALERISRANPPRSIPAKERLSKEQAQTLWQKLTNGGYVSGPLAAFLYHFGPIAQEKGKTQAEALIWGKSPALFAFFVLKLSGVMTKTANPYPTNNTAFIAAFPGQKLETLASGVKEIRNESRKVRGAEALAEIISSILPTQ